MIELMNLCKNITISNKQHNIFYLTTELHKIKSSSGNLNV